MGVNWNTLTMEYFIAVINIKTSPVRYLCITKGEVMRYKICSPEPSCIASVATIAIDFR